MAEVKPSTSRGEESVELVGEASCSGADGSTNSVSIPPSIAAESPSFLLTVCSGVCGARGGGLVGPRMFGLASGAHHSLEDSESEVLRRIEASKSTWSEVPGRDSESEVLSPIEASKSTGSEVPAHDIHESVSVPRSVWEELKISNPLFFYDHVVLNLELGRRIGEGSQAEIFEVKTAGQDLVLKVFKSDAGFSLADLKRLWPRCMRKDGKRLTGDRTLGQERSSGFIFENVNSNIYGNRSSIMFAILLKDGCFAFLMERYWGDLGTLIERKVEDNTHPWEFDLLFRNGQQPPPFSWGESILIMVQIAKGMKGLHAEGVLHRDLKSANVLIGASGVDSMFCVVADYECAMLVQGTGFWRAPEVLQELQKYGKVRNDEIWTEKVDVYSFGMTCYEILTGQIPFDGYTKSKWGDVIGGERPVLPTYVFPELRELVEACWHKHPSGRPSFNIIVDKLSSLSTKHKTWN